MSSSREKRHRRPSSRMKRNNPTKEVSGWTSHVVSSASQSNRGLAVSNPLGTKCLRAGISSPGHSRGSLSYKSNWKRAGGGKRERQDSELEFRPTCSGGDTNSINKLSNKAMGSLGQGMSTEIHCLPCLHCHCHCHPENVLFCLGHLRGKGELCDNTLRMATQRGRAPCEC